MKTNFFMLLIILFTVGCQPSKVEQLILDHEQNWGGAKTDLSMKIEKLEKVGVWTGADSLDILRPIFENERDRLRFKYTNRMLDDSLELIDVEQKAKDPVYGYIYESSVESYKESISIKSEILSNLNSDCKGTDLQDDYEHISKLSTNPDSVLYSIYDCTYTIKNPILDGAKQTIDQTYYISPDESVILGENKDNEISLF